MSSNAKNDTHIVKIKTQNNKTRITSDKDSVAVSSPVHAASEWNHTILIPHLEGNRINAPQVFFISSFIARVLVEPQLYIFDSIFEEAYR